MPNSSAKARPRAASELITLTISPPVCRMALTIHSRAMVVAPISAQRVSLVMLDSKDGLAAARAATVDRGEDGAGVRRGPRCSVEAPVACLVTRRPSDLKAGP